ncbi:MAG: 9-O-acetylesterase, partial [Planctomycetota bacterium]
GSDRPEAVTWLPSQVPDFKDFELVYDYDFSPLSENKKIRYRVDRSNLVGEFNRVAYLFELVPRNSQWPNMVFVSMDPFSRDVADLGIPRNQKVQFQTKVFNLNTYSNVKGFKRGVGIPEGMIEFYRQRYDPQKSSVLNIGSDVVRDFNDTMTNAIYGSFQVHDLANQQTVFAFNNFFQTNGADVGIGNNTIKGSDGIAHPDWTFRKNAEQFLKKRLRIYVRPIARKATH